MIKEWLRRRRERKLDQLVLESIDKCRKECHLMPDFKLPDDDNNTWEALVYLRFDNGSLFGSKELNFKKVIKGRRSAYCVARARALTIDQSFSPSFNIGIDWEINKV